MATSERLLLSRRIRLAFVAVHNSRREARESEKPLPPALVQATPDVLQRLAKPPRSKVEP